MKTTTIAGLALAGAVVLGGPAAVSQAATGVRPAAAESHRTTECGCEHAHHAHHHHKRPAAPHAGGHGRHHHKKHPAPKPAPKPCPPPKHHHPKPKPPVVTPPSSTPIRPVITPGPPAANVGTPANVQTVAAVTPASLPTQLAYTGFDVGDFLVVAVIVLAVGGLLIGLVVLTEPARRFNRQVTR